MNTAKRFMQQPRFASKGFVTLLGVLIVGAIGTAITLSLLVFGVGASRTSLSLQQSHQAKALANACAEHALNELRLSQGYGGNEPYTFAGNTCQIYPIQTVGNTTTIHTTGTVGDVIRKAEVILSQLQPSLTVSSWQEKDF
ncbi:hypothetical protein HY620_02840 [Candidatus Uhrbacteria bacterium]|nr:hypothetical protein [Candidatus Uhrbacteria bacterium]